MPVETASEDTYAEFVDLVRRIEQGDESGMEHLYQLLSTGIRFFLMRRLQHPDVEDKVHEVFVDVVCAIRRQEIRDPARLMGFVRTVIQRKLAKQIDNLVRSRGEHADYNDIQRLPDGKETPEQIAAAKELDGLVSATLKELNPRDRELLVRFYLWEQTGEQICKEMSLSATQFRVFKSRAKARFGDLGRKTVMVPRTHSAAAPRHRVLRVPVHFPAQLAKASS
jgi:RNA polymerase sigma-70 factor (ECF subfamily)